MYFYHISPPPSSLFDLLGYFICSFRPFSSSSLISHLSTAPALEVTGLCYQALPRVKLGFQAQLPLRSGQALCQLSLVPALLVQSSVNSSPSSLFSVQHPVPRSHLSNRLLAPKLGSLSPPLHFDRLWFSGMVSASQSSSSLVRHTA